MNRYRILIGLHISYFFLLFGFVYLCAEYDSMNKVFGVVVKVFGGFVPIGALFFILANSLLLLILIIFSWKAATDAPTKRLRSYFWTFRWVGIMFLVSMLFIFGGPFLAMFISSFQTLHKQ